jgi:hypothetical protein
VPLGGEFGRSGQIVRMNILEHSMPNKVILQRISGGFNHSPIQMEQRTFGVSQRDVQRQHIDQISKICLH